MIKTKGYEIKNKEIILKDIHRELNIENILYITVPGVEFEEIKSVENKEIGFIICKGEMIPVDLGLRDKKGNNLIHVLKVNYDIPYKFTEHGHIYLS